MNRACLLTLTLSLILSTVSVNAQDKAKDPKTVKSKLKMDISKLTHPVVRNAFEAWQNGDSNRFLSFFSSDAALFDDGNPRNLKKFVKEACGHERFTSIDKVEKDGLDIYGNFHTESWGDFKTYFKFLINAEGKIKRLDIGQAN